MTFRFHKRYRSSYWVDLKVVSCMLPEKQPFTFEALTEQLSSGINPTPKLERVINLIQDICMFPADLIHSIRIYIKNSKGNTHVLDGGLDKGQWYDLTYRIPHCLFGELVKYIEQEKGLDVLQWEKTLVLDEDMGYSKDDPDHGQPTNQAESAVEQEIVYKWWLANKGRDFYLEAGGDYGKMTLIEAKYEQEETEMLVRLIKARTSLWT